MQFRLFALAFVGLAMAYTDDELAEGRRKISSRSLNTDLDLNLFVRQSDSCTTGYKSCSSTNCCPTDSSCCGTSSCYYPETQICCSAGTYDGYCSSTDGESCCGDYCCLSGYTCASETSGTCKRGSRSSDAAGLGISVLGALGGAVGALAVL